MERLRFQGVMNIIRFNWHFYLLSILFAAISIFLGWHVSGGRYLVYAAVLSLSVIAVSGLSLLVSFYIYDLSGLYKLTCLSDVSPGRMINIHAGFDETSHLLLKKYPLCELTVFDFYDPAKHTEISIARARRAYPCFPGTIRIETTAIPLASDSIDTGYLIFAAHEIRERRERVTFFKELDRVLKTSGRIVVVEHLRDWRNFLAYNIGFFHFLPSFAWRETFQGAGLRVCDKKKITPFVTIYILRKNGIEC